MRLGSCCKIKVPSREVRAPLNPRPFLPLLPKWLLHLSSPPPKKEAIIYLFCFSPDGWEKKRNEKGEGKEIALSQSVSPEIIVAPFVRSSSRRPRPPGRSLKCRRRQRAQGQRSRGLRRPAQEILPSSSPFAHHRVGLAGGRVARLACHKYPNKYMVGVLIVCINYLAERLWNF